MKRILSIAIVLSVCVSATWASALNGAGLASGEGDTATGGRFAVTVEGALAAGLNSFSPRGMQVDVAAGLKFGKYVSAAVGIGVRHAYTLVSVDHNVHGYGEPDQRAYGDRFLLPLFVRVKGGVPVGSFSWAGASFEPFARLDVGYAVDLQESVATSRRPNAGGPFVLPAAGLDMRLQDGSAWMFAVGVGIHAAQYVTEDHATATTSPTTGNAVSLNFVLGRNF